MSFSLKHKPCNKDYCSSGYGTRNISVSGASTYHRGFDIPGTGSIYAMASGTIKEKGYNSARGYYVVVKHTSTYSTGYQDMGSACSLKVGKKVKAGDKIGIIGSTGVGSKHLHIELRKNNIPINPQPYLIKAFMPSKITHTLQRITGYNLKALAWRWYLDVACMQKKLKANGYYDGNIDGRFEAKTEKAVKKFQKSKGLKQDGSCGPKTYKELNKLSSKVKANPKTYNVNREYKWKQNMKVRNIPTKSSKSIGILKKNKKVKVTKVRKKYGDKYKWAYCPSLKGWICIKYNTKQYGIRVK